MIGMIRASLKTLLRHSYARFKEQLDSPRRAQEALLKDLIANLAATEYGRSFGVEKDDGYEAFARKATVAGFVQIGGWIERQKRCRTCFVLRKKFGMFRAAEIHSLHGPVESFVQPDVFNLVV